MGNHGPLENGVYAMTSSALASCVLCAGNKRVPYDLSEFFFLLKSKDRPRKWENSFLLLSPLPQNKCHIEGFMHFASL